MFPMFKHCQKGTFWFQALKNRVYLQFSLAPYAICSCHLIDFVCISPNAICEADHQMLSANKYIALTFFFSTSYPEW